MAHDKEHGHPHHGHGPAAVAEPPAGRAARQPGLVWLSIPAMDCAAEEGEIRRALDQLPGLRSLQFKLTNRTLGIDAPADSIPLAISAIAKTGYKASRLETEPLDAGAGHGHGHGHEGCAHDHHDHPHGRSSVMAQAVARAEIRYGLALLLAFAAEAIAYLAPDSLAWRVLGMGIAVGAIVLAGLSTYAKGLSALRHGRIGINALMTVAVSGAFLIGQWPEAAMVMALYAIAELIEARSVDRARGAIKELMNLAPETAEIRGPDRSWSVVASSSVAVGQTLRIKPGARVPLDVSVTSGFTTVDQAAVTGESLPVERHVGDALYAGTVNLTNTVEAVATATRSNTLLSRIIHAVEQAQGSRAPTQAFVDRFAALYTPVVFVIALLVAVVGPLVLGWPWLQGVYKALVLLVIACPCALVISTPVTIVSGLASAARRGILIKGGVHLENARKIQFIALDKTGTVTQGKPRLVQTEVSPQVRNEDEVLHWASDMAAHSDHPVSQAVAAGLAGLGCDGDLESFELLPGQGIKARAHGLELWLGNHRLMESLGVCGPQIEQKLSVHEAQGRTVTMLASREQVLAIFAVADGIKDSSREAIAMLSALGVATTILSGDNQATTDAIAREAGVAQARGELLPQDKLEAIHEMRARAGGRLVAMVGDGINDAPALAASDLGIAMGSSGTDVAIEAADIAIMNDDLRRIPETIRLSNRTHAILLQNLALALGIKAAFLGLAIFDSATLWMAVFADMGASLLVVGNGLRLLRP